MSPDIIAVDELGRREDVAAVEEVLNAGVKLIATAHGRDLPTLKQDRSCARLSAGKYLNGIFSFQPKRHRHRRGLCDREGE